MPDKCILNSHWIAGYTRCCGYTGEKKKCASVSLTMELKNKLICLKASDLKILRCLFLWVLLLIRNEQEDDIYKHTMNSVRNQTNIPLIHTLKKKSGRLSIAY